MKKKLRTIMSYITSKMFSQKVFVNLTLCILSLTLWLTMQKNRAAMYTVEYNAIRDVNASNIVVYFKYPIAKQYTIESFKITPIYDVNFNFFNWVQPFNKHNLSYVEKYNLLIFNYANYCYVNDQRSKATVIFNALSSAMPNLKIYYMHNKSVSLRYYVSNIAKYLSTTKAFSASWVHIVDYWSFRLRNS